MSRFIDSTRAPDTRLAFPKVWIHHGDGTKTRRDCRPGPESESFEIFRLYFDEVTKRSKSELEDFLVETHVPPRPGPLSVKPRMVKPLLRLRRPGVPAVCRWGVSLSFGIRLEHFGTLKITCGQCRRRKSGLRVKG